MNAHATKAWSDYHLQRNLYDRETEPVYILLAIIVYNEGGYE
jgi:hypothetical protein